MRNIKTLFSKRCT